MEDFWNMGRELRMLYIASELREMERPARMN